MSSFFQFFGANAFILLFLTVGLAVWLGRQSVGGYGLGMVAAAIIVGCARSVWGSAYGVKLALDNFTKSMFYYLFMYGVGLRVGPGRVSWHGRRHRRGYEAPRSRLRHLPSVDDHPRRGPAHRAGLHRRHR